MKWSLLVGKFWGTEIRLHWSMLLLIPYTLIAFRPSGPGESTRVLLLIAAIFVCVALHEMGHTIAARLFGIQVSSIMLWPLGGIANLPNRPEKVWKDLIISAAGPATNFLVFIWLAMITGAERIFERSMAYPALSQILWDTSSFAFLLSLTVANLSLALFNLVPVFPLDGGQIARGLLKAIFGEKRADFIMLVVSLPLALALTVLGFVTGDVIIILTGLILILASVSLNVRLFNGLALAWIYLFDRAGYYLRRSDFDPALREYDKAIRRNPDRPGAYISRAIVHMNLMDLRAAAGDIDRALALDGRNWLAWGLRGELLALSKNHASALSAYNRAIELRPNWSTAYLDRGGLYQDMGDINRAVEDMNKAVVIGRGSPVSYVMRSMLRYQMGNPEGSRADTDQALRYAPHWMLVFPEVFLSNLEGHLGWALDYYGRAIQHMPKAYQAYMGRADACRVNHRLDWAIADYNRAAEMSPNAAEIYLNRGRTYQELGKLDWASEDFRRAAQLTKKSHIRRQAEGLLGQLTSGAPLLRMEKAAPAPATGGSAAASEQGAPAAQ